MSGASFDLQTRLYELLTDAGVAGGSVYDDVPEAVASATAPDAAFPYVEIGEADVIADDADAEDGTRDDGVTETITLHAWSRYRGQKEVKEIMQQVKDLVHDTELTVPGRSSALCAVTMMRSFLDPDGRTRHGVITVEVTHRN